MTFQRGHPQYGHIRKGQKQFATIEKEKARQHFEEIQLSKWNEIAEKQLADALIDRQSREYSINQVIGKPTENINMKGGIKIELDIL